ncbi:MAG: hypothetical protein FWF88_07595 [Peptococcaceae bacterium]|nr:hypothetical protein [Peptococcaceae bacterium]
MEIFLDPLIRPFDRSDPSRRGQEGAVDNGQWTMDKGQCENLADDTMASYHEVPYL